MLRWRAWVDVGERGAPAGDERVGLAGVLVDQRQEALLLAAAAAASAPADLRRSPPSSAIAASSHDRCTSSRAMMYW